MVNLIIEWVISVYYWMDSLFSFIISCDFGFCFKNGYFIMIGLENEG